MLKIFCHLLVDNILKDWAKRILIVKIFFFLNYVKKKECMMDKIVYYTIYYHIIYTYFFYHC